MTTLSVDYATTPYDPVEDMSAEELAAKLTEEDAAWEKRQAARKHPKARRTKGGRFVQEASSKYSEDQPRDEQGRFGETGGSSSGSDVVSSPRGEVSAATVDAAWTALNADRFDTLAQREAHPENYEPNRGFGDHLKEGATEWRRDVDANGVPTIYQVQAVAWAEMGATAEERLANNLAPASMPMRGPDGLIGLQRVEGSERPDPYVYRIMSSVEYDQAQERGYFQSNQSMNLADEGTVASRGSTGTFYAPLDGSDLRIVQFDMNPADGWRVDSDGYVKTHDPVPAERVHAYTEPITQPKKAAPRGGTRVKYSEDQPRDDHGRFGETADAEQPAATLDLKMRIGTLPEEDQKIARAMLERLSARYPSAFAQIKSVEATPLKTRWGSFSEDGKLKLTNLGGKYEEYRDPNLAGTLAHEVGHAVVQDMAGGYHGNDQLGELRENVTYVISAAMDRVGAAFHYDSEAIYNAITSEFADNPDYVLSSQEELVAQAFSHSEMGTRGPIADAVGSFVAEHYGKAAT